MGVITGQGWAVGLHISHAVLRRKDCAAGAAAQTAAVCRKDKGCAAGWSGAVNYKEVNTNG